MYILYGHNIMTYLRNASLSAFSDILSNDLCGKETSFVQN